MLANMVALTALFLSMEQEDALFRKRQGFWLRAARESANIPQEVAAKEAGLRSKSAISDYEKGATQVPQDKLRRLAKLYGWPLAFRAERQASAISVNPEPSRIAAVPVVLRK